MRYRSPRTCPGTNRAVSPDGRDGDEFAIVSASDTDNDPPQLTQKRCESAFDVPQAGQRMEWADYRHLPPITFLARCPYIAQQGFLDVRVVA